MEFISVYLIAIMIIVVLSLIGGGFLFYDRIKKHIEKNKSSIPVEAEDKNNSALRKGIIIGVAAVILIITVREIISYLISMNYIMWMWHNPLLR